VVVIAFQSVFHSEKCANNIFYFLKIIFEINTSKWFENIKNILLQSKKKKSNFFGSTFEKHSQIKTWWKSKFKSVFGIVVAVVVVILKKLF